MVQDLKRRRRSDYVYHLEYRTRWSDNDMYDHMNNSVYYFLYARRPRLRRCQC